MLCALDMLLGRCRALKLLLCSPNQAVSVSGTLCEVLASFANSFGLSISETGLLICLFLPGWLRLIEICEVLRRCSNEQGRNVGI